MTPLAQQEHDAEQIRQDAFAVFVASVRDYAAADGWAYVLKRVLYRYDADSGAKDSIGQDLTEFSHGYGWPDTLRAIAQAMQADEQMKRELEARR